MCYKTFCLHTRIDATVEQNITTHIPTVAQKILRLFYDYKKDHLLLSIEIVISESHKIHVMMITTNNNFMTWVTLFISFVWFVHQSMLITQSKAIRIIKIIIQQDFTTFWMFVTWCVLFLLLFYVVYTSVDELST